MLSLSRKSCVSFIKRSPVSVSAIIRKMARVAVCQMLATNDIEENFRKVKNLVLQAKQENASMVFLPECCDYVGENRAETLKLSEETLATGKLFSRYRSLAKDNALWLSLGGLHERIGQTDKLYNCHVVVDANGEVAGVYRKLHLFDVDTPEFKFRESLVVSPGPTLVSPIDTPIGPLGLQICYDMRFPEASVLLRKQGANILTYPSAFAYTTGVAHWEVLLRSRAIENQCFVIAPAQTGWHNKKRRSYGRAMIIDPWGKVLAETTPENGEELIVVDIDLNRLEEVRLNMPCFEHRRDDIYQLNTLRESTGVDSKSTHDYDFGGHLIPKDIVFMQSKHSIAFTNIRCVVPGHVLIASKRRAPRLDDLSAVESADFFQLAMKVQRLVAKVHAATSVTVTVQDGEDAGQTVKHVHCHVMPRHKGDFEQNDMIYTELNKHDKDEQQKRRSVAEMVEEAQRYKKEVEKEEK